MCDSFYRERTLHRLLERKQTRDIIVNYAPQKKAVQDRLDEYRPEVEVGCLLMLLVPLQYLMGLL